METQQVLSQLGAEGTAQNRKIYARHGASEPMYGVSYAALNKLRKQLGVNHTLALELWESGVHDARVLATMIADPARLSAVELDRWVREAGADQVVAGAVAKLAGLHKTAPKRIAKWTAAGNQWVAAAGWCALSVAAGGESDLKDDDFRMYLRRIEQSIQAAPNRARHEMNQALIAIGLRNEALRVQAIAAARAIGRVEVDHGETSCKTPSAEAYIEKTLARRRQLAAKKQPAAKAGRGKPATKKRTARKATG